MVARIGLSASLRAIVSVIFEPGSPRIFLTASSSAMSLIRGIVDAA
jgi:hypothetical protein